MTVAQLFMAIMTFGLTFWLGLYLIGRDLTSLLLWLSGLSLITYAALIALLILDGYAPTIRAAQIISRTQQLALLLPVFFWLGYLIRLAPRENIWRRHMKHTRCQMLIILVGTIIFAVGLAFYQFSFAWLSRFAILAGLAVNLLVLGVSAAALDAHRQGETLWPHLLRSLDYAFFTALLFGGQVALVMWLATGTSFVMLSLLLVTIATAVLVQTYAGRVTRWVDRIAFFIFPDIRQTRDTLRSGADAATRVKSNLDLDAIPADEFTRLTRRALSQMGNLPKLASNPLTRLPVVTARLGEQGVQIDTLSRATELRQVLTESIARLKPDDEAQFGTTDEWRHYNALHFLYVVGLRPYRRYTSANGLAPAEREALEWFRSQVPRRTLYNWQSEAARLIARDLREHSHIAQRQAS